MTKPDPELAARRTAARAVLDDYRRAASTAGARHGALWAGRLADMLGLVLDARGPGKQAELADLVHHWGSAYSVEFTDGRWTARPLDGRPAFSAADAITLRIAIRDDYARHWHPR